MHVSVQVEAGAVLFHLQSRPAGILVKNWDLGRPVALDIIVVLPLNPSTLAEVEAMVGEAMESWKNQANDEKCAVAL